MLHTTPTSRLRSAIDSGHDLHLRVLRRLKQASVGLLIAGLHGVGIVFWWTAQHGMQLEPVTTRLPPITVSLPALPEPTANLARQPTRQPKPTDLPRPRDSRKSSTSTDAAVVLTSPQSNAVSQPVDVVVSGEGHNPIEPTLNLILSRKDIASAAPRSFAEQSSFRGRLPKTVERQIANAAAESGPWTEERMGNDQIRFRRGNTCVVAQRPRAASIDPMNEASARIPWRFSEATDCND